jgi:hypothetical protein
MKNDKNKPITSREVLKKNLNTPIENVVAMFDAFKEFNKIKQI